MKQKIIVCSYFELIQTSTVTIYVKNGENYILLKISNDQYLQGLTRFHWVDQF